MWFYDQYERTDEEIARKTTEAMEKMKDFANNMVDLEPEIVDIVDKEFFNILL